jgi:tripartite-type tricarboxylate transporter receptor subunit TctC
MKRRDFIALAAGSAALASVPRIARAQPYPSRPVHLIEGFGAGGTPDIISRVTGQWLSDRLWRSFIIENRSGASGNIATAAVAHASPDGYTLLMIVPTNAINVTFYNKLDFSFARDIVPVGRIAHGPLIMQVHPSVPATNVPEFIAYAKANPGKINMGSAGTGSLLHMTGELFAMMAGVEMFHVPFRGVQSLMALLAGQVQVTFSPIPASLEYVKAGKLRALAVTTAQRSPALPDVPAIAEFLPGYEVGTWYGIGAPAGTPAAIIATLNGGINAALADARFNARLTDLGMAPLGGTPAEFDRFMVAEIEKWGKVVRFAGVSAD